MIPFTKRFHGHGSFNYLFKKGQVYRANDYTIRYVKNLRRRQDRYAVVVSKRISKKAVIRNQIRRRVYEIFRLWLQDNPNQFDIVVFINNPKLLEQPFADLQARISADLDQIIKPVA